MANKCLSNIKYLWRPSVLTKAMATILVETLRVAFLTGQTVAGERLEHVLLVLVVHADDLFFILFVVADFDQLNLLLVCAVAAAVRVVESD